MEEGILVGAGITSKMNKIYSLIRNEGICGFLKRVYCSIKRRIYVRLYFIRCVSWSNKQLTLQRNADYPKKILYSIIVPVYNTPEKFLLEMLESCFMQTYPEWELCIADASDEAHSYVGGIISDKLKEDSRIRYLKLENNNGISDNTNEALKIARGDYIVLLDHDDMLHPSALYECMAVLQKTCADFIYTDELVFEKKINNVKSIHLKPDFSPDSLRGNNYICHMSVFSRELVERTGFFIREYDGSQDYDMILRLTELAKNIIHIPKVLYFWRSHSGSVAGGISAKTYTVEAGRRAVISHIDRIGRSGKVESNPEFPIVYNIKYDVPEDIHISILIWGTDKNRVSYESISKLEINTDYVSYDIAVGGVVSDGDLELISQKYVFYKDISDIHEFFNTVSEKAKGKYIVFMNGMSDILSKDWLRQMLMLAMWDNTGAVGIRTLSSQNKIADCGAYVKDYAAKKLAYYSRGDSRSNCGYMMLNMYAHNVDIPSTACIMIGKEKFVCAGGFDFESSDEYCMAAMCLKLKERGYFNICNPLADIIRKPA